MELKPRLERTGGEQGIRAALLRACERQRACMRVGWRGCPPPRLHQLSVLSRPKKSIKPAQLTALWGFSCPAESLIGAGFRSNLNPALIFQNKRLRRVVARVINRYPSSTVL